MLRAFIALALLILVGGVAIFSGAIWAQRRVKKIRRDLDAQLKIIDEDCAAKLKAIEEA